MSSSFSFIAGVATLLLALGVGVLIGHNTNTQKTAAAAPNQTIKVEGIGGGTNTNTTATNTPTSTKSFKATKIPKLTQKQVKKTNAAAATVLGNQGVKNLSTNPTQQVGGKCSGGAGCQGGKFTGNFFGGG